MQLGTALDNGAEERLRTGAATARAADLPCLESQVALSLAACMLQCGKPGAHTVILDVLRQPYGSTLAPRDTHDFTECMVYKLGHEGGSAPPPLP